MSSIMNIWTTYMIRIIQNAESGRPNNVKPIKMKNMLTFVIYIIELVTKLIWVA